MYAYWVCATRETPIFSPEFPFRSISSSQISKKSVPEHHHFTFFFADFAVPETISFKISLNSTRSSPPTAGSARTQRRGLARRVLAVPESPIFTLKRIKLVSEPPIFKLKTAQGRSGDPHFHARPGARYGALNFSLCRGTYTYQNLG